MKFGISLVPDSGEEDKSAADYYREVLRLCRIADEGGLEWVKMTEHYLHAYGGYSPDPLVFLATVGAQTERVRLMTGGVLPVFHHPVILASRAAMVDVLTGGRLDLGFARGYLPYEHDTFGVPMEESHERFEASVNALTRLLTEENVTEKTPFFAFENATVLPRPTQQPIPLWSAAVRADKSFVRLGEQGHGLLATPMVKPLETFRDQIALYRDSFRPATPGATAQVVVSLPIFVAENDKEAVETGDRLLEHYWKVWADSTDSWNGTTSDSFPTYSQMGERLRSLPISAWREMGSAWFGSPERVADQIRAFHEESGGVEGVIAQVDFGSVPLEVAERSLRLFLDEVLPKVADL